MNSSQSAAYALVSASSILGSQVDEGDIEVLNIRETDGRLGPLIIIMVALGAATLTATVMYWWATRPSRTITLNPTITPNPQSPPTQGDDDG